MVEYLLNGTLAQLGYTLPFVLDVLEKITVLEC